MALLAQARLRDPGRGRRRCTAPRAPSPGRSGARRVVLDGIGRERPPGAPSVSFVTAPMMPPNGGPRITRRSAAGLVAEPER